MLFREIIRSNIHSVQWHATEWRFERRSYNLL